MYAIDVQSKPATWLVWVSLSGAPEFHMWMVLGPMLSILNYEVVPVGGRPKNWVSVAVQEDTSSGRYGSPHNTQC